MARAHHVGERQQRGHQRVIRSHGKREQRSIRQRDADRFTLAAIELSAAPPPAMDAGGLQSLLAELAGAVRPREGSDHQITLLHRAHVGSHSLDETDELVTHAVTVSLAGIEL
jgi:hypothetical protein